MFEEEEQKARKELIQLYEDFLNNPNDPTLEERASTCHNQYGGSPVLSEIVSRAGTGALNIALNELSNKEAEEILEELKK